LEPEVAQAATEAAKKNQSIDAMIEVLSNKVAFVRTEIIRILKGEPPKAIPQGCKAIADELRALFLNDRKALKKRLSEDLVNELFGEDKIHDLLANLYAGDALKKMLQHVPSGLAGPIMDIEGVKKTAGVFVGRNLREMVAQHKQLPQMNQWFKNMLQVLVPHVKIVETKEKQPGKPDFDRVIVVPKDGDKFEFAAKLSAEESRVQAEEIKDTLLDRIGEWLTQVFEISVGMFFDTWIRQPWNRLQNCIDIWIQEKLGDSGTCVKEYLDQWFSFIFFEIIGRAIMLALALLYYPIRWIIKFAMSWTSRGVRDLPHEKHVEFLTHNLIDAFFRVYLPKAAG
jgi:hypothetical protein